jgi:hypothetical protein
MNWKIIVAVVVAFGVGGAAGTFAEHERVKNDKPATQATTAANADWFGTRATAACPALKRWNASAVATYKALGQKTWKDASAALATQITATRNAYRALAPVANAAGKVELRILLAHQNKLTAALKEASSVSTYLAAQKKVTPARVTRDVAIVGRAAQRCSTAT